MADDLNNINIEIPNISQTADVLSERVHAAGTSSDDLSTTLNEQAQIENTGNSKAPRQPSASQLNNIARTQAGMEAAQERLAREQLLTPIIVDRESSRASSAAFGSARSEIEAAGAAEIVPNRVVASQANAEKLLAQAAKEKALAQSAQLRLQNQQENVATSPDDWNAGVDLFQENFTGTSDELPQQWREFQQSQGLKKAPKAIRDRMNDFYADKAYSESLGASGTPEFNPESVSPERQASINSTLDRLTELQKSKSGSNPGSTIGAVANQGGLNQEADLLREWTKDPEKAASLGTKKGSEAFSRELDARMNGRPVAADEVTYKDVKAGFLDSLTGLQNAYAQENRAWEVENKSAGYLSDIESLKSAHGLASPPAPPVESKPGDRYKALKSDYSKELGSLNDRYTDEGRAWEIGGKSDAYTGEVTELQRSMGLAAPEEEIDNSFRGRVGRNVSSLGNFMKSRDMGYAIGFGAFSAGAGIEKANQDKWAGNPYLADQAAEQTSTSFAPLVGGLVGTLGTFAATKSPQLAMGGMMAGQMGGTLLEDYLNTTAGGHTFAQEKSGQEIGYNRGGVEAVEAFTDALKNAATPAAKELADSFVALNKTGPLASGAAAAFGQQQYSQGFAYSSNVAAQDAFLSSSPFLAGARSAYGGGDGGPGSYKAFGVQGNLSLAEDAALSGDYPGMEAFIGNARTSQENPQYVKDKKFVDNYDDKVVGMPTRFMNSIGLLWNQRFHALDLAGARLEKESPLLPGSDPKALNTSATAIESDYQSYEANLGDISRSETLVSGDMSKLQVKMLIGGGSSDINAAMPGAIRDANIARQAYQRQINLADTEISSGRYKAGKDLADLENKRAQGYEGLYKMDLVAPNLERERFDTTLEEGQTHNSLLQAQFGLDIGNSFYSGGTYASNRNTEIASLTASGAYSDWMRKMAASKVTGPADAAKYAAAASANDLDIQKRRNDYTWNMDQEADRHENVAINKIRSEIAVRSFSDTPDQIYSADRKITGLEDVNIAGINNRISTGKGVLTDPQMDSLKNELASSEAKRAADANAFSMNRYTGDANIFGSKSDILGNTTNIDALTKGSFGAVGDFRKLRDADADKYTNYLNATTDPTLSPEQVSHFQDLASGAKSNWYSDQMKSVQFTDDPTHAANSIGMEHALNRASYSFMEPGNINQLRGRVFSDIGRKQKIYEAQIKGLYGDNVPDFAKPAIAEQEEAFKDKRAQVGYQMDTEFFKKLPALTIGGTSFEKRYLPTYSQAADYTESHGGGGVGAYNFGFRKSETYNAAAGEMGPLLTAGKSQAEIAPGNQSIQALSSMAGIAAAVQAGVEAGIAKVAGLISSAPRPMPMAATVQSNNSQTRGLAGGGLPGAGN